MVDRNTAVDCWLGKMFGSCATFIHTVTMVQYSYERESPQISYAPEMKQLHPTYSCHHVLMSLTHWGLQSCFGAGLVGVSLVCPQNGAAVLKQFKRQRLLEIFFCKTGSRCCKQTIGRAAPEDSQRLSCLTTRRDSCAHNLLPSPSSHVL